jgi:virulence-associated protein VagC
MRVDATEVTISREGDRLVIAPVSIERDAKGWPKAWWRLAGSAPDFDLGPRDAPHERGNVLSRKSR